MKKKVSRRKKIVTPHHHPIGWLPIDHRFFPFIYFGEVKGVARVFLQIEIGISLLVVMLTLLAAMFKIFLYLGKMV
jgi:hypothetical protein